MYVWPFMPQSTYTEALEWRTDVIRTRTNEQRICIRELPRQSFVYANLLSEQQYSRAKVLTRSIGATEFKIPNWSSFVEIGPVSSGANVLSFDTTELAFYDSLMIWDDDKNFEEVAISNVYSASVALSSGALNDYVNAIAVPLVSGYFANPPKFSVSTDHYIKCEISFITTDPAPVQEGDSYPVFDSLPVLTDRNALVNAMDESIQRELSRIDSITGKISLSANSDYDAKRSIMRWDIIDKSELFALRKWLQKLKGKQKHFLMPSWNRDLSITADITISDTQILIESIGLNALQGPFYVMILLFSGSINFVKIDSAAAGAPGEEILSVSAGVPFSVAVSNIDIACLLTPMRLDTDRIEIKHIPSARAMAAAAVIEVPA